MGGRELETLRNAGLRYVVRGSHNVRLMGRRWHLGAGRVIWGGGVLRIGQRACVLVLSLALVALSFLTSPPRLPTFLFCPAYDDGVQNQGTGSGRGQGREGGRAHNNAIYARRGSMMYQREYPPWRKRQDSEGGGRRWCPSVRWSISCVVWWARIPAPSPPSLPCLSR